MDKHWNLDKANVAVVSQIANQDRSMQVWSALSTSPKLKSELDWMDPWCISTYLCFVEVMIHIWVLVLVEALRSIRFFRDGVALTINRILFQCYSKPQLDWRQNTHELTPQIYVAYVTWNRAVPSRKFLGVCPQHDVIWSGLTVREHLEFFAQAPLVSLWCEYRALVPWERRRWGSDLVFV